MKKVRYILDKILEIVSIAILSIMSILVVYQVIARYILNNPSSWSESVVTYGFIWLSMICGSYVFGKRDHMAMTFVLDKVKGKKRVVLEMISEFIILLFAIGVLTIGGYLGALAQMTQADSILPISMGMIYIAIPIAGISMVLYFFCNEYDLSRKLANIEEEE